MKLSIITIHLDDFSGLVRTVNSLESLLCNDQCEWIVVDGGSGLKNGGEEILHRCESLADQFIRETDDGVYDAMNKGTRLATCDYVLYLNAGDELHPDFSLDDLHQAIGSNSVAMAWGRADVRDRTGKVYPRKTRRPFWLTYGMAVSHQAILFRRELLGDEPYDTNLKIASDYDLICKLYKSGVEILMVDMPICVYDLVGKSSHNRRVTLKEESRVRRKYFGFSAVTDRIIMELKSLAWSLGTILPAFKRAWSKFF